MNRAALDPPATAFTIGHSARPLAEFLMLLRANGVSCVVDVRSFPYSRHNPQFNGERLADVLGDGGIRYMHLTGLGGRRRPLPGSPNGGWRNASFRGYADYMLTPEFDAALRTVTELATGERTALMCAEAVPWRCHRSLIADALVVGGLAVAHILGPGQLRLHVLTPFARVSAGRLSYPPEDDPQSPAADAVTGGAQRNGGGDP
ncbi:MAG: DUF488 domain-containing protein [Acidiferrobacterales bacterium]